MLYTTAEENYPVGIGKHIVCIDAAAHGTALQTACRGNPEPPYYFSNPTVAESEVNKTKNKTKMVAMRFSESDHRAIKRKAEQANMKQGSPSAPARSRKRRTERRRFTARSTARF